MKNQQTDIAANGSTVTTPVEPMIEINNLKKGFGKQEVLKNISLTAS